MDIDEDALVYDVNVRENEFNAMETYSLRLQKAFTMNVVSREAQREIISIFNEVLDDFDNLRKFKVCIIVDRVLIQDYSFKFQNFFR